MPRVLIIENRYPVDADQLFRLVTDLDTLEAVTKPWVRIDHLPSGQVREGQVIDVAMSVFGVLPMQPYRMRVVSLDAQARTMVSVEDGLGVNRLRHALSVTEDGDGAVLCDRIEIDAGWLTAPVMIWARITYRWRHHVRMRLLSKQTRSRS